LIEFVIEQTGLSCGDANRFVPVLLLPKPRAAAQTKPASEQGCVGAAWGWGSS